MNDETRQAETQKLTPAEPKSIQVIRLIWQMTDTPHNRQLMLRAHTAIEGIAQNGMQGQSVLKREQTIIASLQSAGFDKPASVPDAVSSSSAPIPTEQPAAEQQLRPTVEAPGAGLGRAGA